ncbi:MAG: hypothetical protein ACK45I_04015 [Bacteroidota bacterium]|jgi:hypothetical protein
MKVPELTITELLEIMKMIEANLDGLMSRLNKIDKQVDFRRRFWPFPCRRFILAKNAEILFIRAELRLQKNLHEKLLMSVGMGEDMKEVTLKEAVDKIKASAKR